MKLCCGLMEGQMWAAMLQPSPEFGGEGRLVVVLSNEEVLSPADAEYGEFSIVEATEAEREGLQMAGYAMKDYSPEEAPACAAYHDEEPEGEALAEGGEEQA